MGIHSFLSYSIVIDQAYDLIAPNSGEVLQCCLDTLWAVYFAICYPEDPE